MLIDFEQLAAFCKRERPGAVITWCNKHKIAWTTDADGNPITTLTQIDKVLEHDQSVEGEFSFDGPT